MSKYRLAFVDRSEARVQSMEIETDSFATVLDIAERTDGFTAVDIAIEGQKLVRLLRGGPDGSKVWQILPRS